jgi:hypothetical protein
MRRNHPFLMNSAFTTVPLLDWPGDLGKLSGIMR